MPSTAGTFTFSTWQFVQQLGLTILGLSISSIFFRSCQGCQARSVTVSGSVLLPRRLSQTRCAPSLPHRTSCLWRACTACTACTKLSQAPALHWSMSPLYARSARSDPAPLITVNHPLSYRCRIPGIPGAYRTLCAPGLLLV